MAAPINLPVNAPANIDIPSTGRYNLFLNSSDNDYLYKKDSSDISTPVVAAGTGTVISVAMTVPTGLSVSGSPVTTSGTLAVTLTAGYVIPTTTEETNWNTAYTNRITSLTTTGTSGAATLAGNVLNIPQYQASGTYLVPADIGVTVQGYSASTTLLGNTTTGSGSIVLGISPTITTGITAGSSAGISLISSGTSTCFLIGAGGGQNNTAYGVLKLDYGTASTVVYLDASKNLVSLANGTGVLTNNGAGVLSWATVAGGVSIGDTIGNSPVTGSVLMVIGTTLTQSISYRAQQATPFGTYFGYQAANATPSGVKNTLYGYQSGLVVAAGARNTFVGYKAGVATTTGNSNVFIGDGVGYGNISGSNNTYINTYPDDSGASPSSSGSNNIFVGLVASTFSGNNNVAIGGNNTTSGTISSVTSVGHGASCTNTQLSAAYGASAVCSADYTLALGEATYCGHSFSIALGRYAATTAQNQWVVGAINNGGIQQAYFGQGVTAASPQGFTLNATGGSGANNAGASLTLVGGKGTGSGAGGSVIISTALQAAPSSTIQPTLTPRLTISYGAVTTNASTATWADALDFVFSGTTGTKIASAASQKISFWGVTPIVQPTTAVGSATFVSPGGGTQIKTDDTFDGYTLQQIVKLIRNIGIAA